MKALHCPYCGSEITIMLETVGTPYLSREVPEYIECDAHDCQAEWEPNGDPRAEPLWVRWPTLNMRPERAREIAHGETA